MPRHILLAFVAANGFAASSGADIVITAVETGGNVVFTATGSLDVSGLTPTPSGDFLARFEPSAAVIDFGGPGDLYDLAISGGPIGPGGSIIASSRFGDTVGFSAGISDTLVVPSGYVSGTPLFSTITFETATFASLGITPGSYKYTYEYVVIDPELVDPATVLSAVNNTYFVGDSITFSTVPEPSAFLYVGLISVIACCGYGIKRRLAAG
jgi:hypothetical protein